jgi:hypothetical protein
MGAARIAGNVQRHLLFQGAIACFAANASKPRTVLEKFGIQPIGTAEADLQAILG